MAIASLDDYIAAPKQCGNVFKTAGRTTINAIWFNLIDIAGSPVGTLAGTNSANGVVPTDATAGYYPIDAFVSGNTGYLTRVEFGSSTATRFALHDRLFLAGTYSFNSNVTLTSQPSFVSRLPNSDYKGLEIWVECVTPSTGSQICTITYTNQDGVTGRTTGGVNLNAMIIGRVGQMPLQAGDTGVQKIESVLFSGATAGTYNVMILRPLWTGRAPSTGAHVIHTLLDTGMPQVYEDSALFMLIATDGTSSGVPELRFEVANG